MIIYAPSDLATEHALKAFDTFLTQWIPPAIRDHMFSHATNPADTVRHAIRGINDQTLLPIQDTPFGYAAYAQRPDLKRDDWFSYTTESAVFPTLDQAANARQYCAVHRPERGTAYLVGEIRNIT